MSKGRRLRAVLVPRWVIGFALLTCVAQDSCGAPMVNHTDAGAIRTDARRRRAPVLADFLDLRQIAEVRPSPDGRLLAVEEVRPVSGGLGANPYFQRTDILLVNLATDSVKPITNGKLDNGSSWDPIWSPNGKYLAFITNRGRSHSMIRPAIWTRATGAIRLIEKTRSVDIRVNWGNSGAWKSRAWGDWLSNGILATVLEPNGQLADSEKFGAPMSPGRDFARKWRRTSEGRRSVTVWQSYGAAPCGAGDAIVSLNARTWKRQVLYRGAVRGVSVSPRSTYLSVIVSDGRQGANEKYKRELFDVNPYRLDWGGETGLVIVKTQSGRNLGSVRHVHHLTAMSVRRFPVWNAMDTGFAVPSHSAVGDDFVYYVSVPGLQVTKYRTKNALEAEAIVQFLTIDGGPGGYAARFQGRAQLERLTARVPETTFLGGLSVVPGIVFRFTGGKVGLLIHGKLSVLNEEGHVIEAVSGLRGRLVYPSERDAVEGNADRFMLEGATGVLKEVQVRKASVQVSNVGQMSKIDRLNSVLGEKEIVFTRQSSNGTFLSILANGRKRTILSINTYLSEVRRPLQRMLAYTFDGREVRALLWLPKRPGSYRKAPLIVWGYPAWYVNTAELNPLNDFSNYPGNLLAAAGYIVLQPTIPRRPDDSETRYDPIRYFPKAVLASVKAAVSRGYGSRARLGYYGHSYGGYIGLALESETKVFRAIVVTQPFDANLLALDLDVETDAQDLDSCTPSIVRSLGALHVESPGVPLDMGGPPWSKMSRYIMNSPYFHMADAMTPLLMEEGEFDPGLPGARGIFQQLYRRGVPVRLDIYWGEGHNLETRGNLRDGWTRTIRWFRGWVKNSKEGKVDYPP